MSVFIADRRNSFPSPLISDVNYFFLLATLFLNRCLSIPILWSCELYLVAYPTHFQSPYITHYVNNPYFSIYQSTWSTILVALPFQPLSVSSTHLRLCLRSIHISTRCGGLSRPWSPETASPWLADIEYIKLILFELTLEQFMFLSLLAGSFQGELGLVLRRMQQVSDLGGVLFLQKKWSYTNCTHRS
jgi:hypothetical protein